MGFRCLPVQAPRLSRCDNPGNFGVVMMWRSARHSMLAEKSGCMVRLLISLQLPLVYYRNSVSHVDKNGGFCGQLYQSKNCTWDSVLTLSP
eukprot:gene14698-biopygen5138